MIPCQWCCHTLIVILFVSNALWYFDKLGVFPNVPISSLHAFLLIKHIFQTMTENANIWPVPTWERAMNPHKPTHLDTKSKFTVKAHILEFVAQKSFTLPWLSISMSFPSTVTKQSSPVSPSFQFSQII